MSSTHNESRLAACPLSGVPGRFRAPCQLILRRVGKCVASFAGLDTARKSAFDAESTVTTAFDKNSIFNVIAMSPCRALNDGSDALDVWMRYAGVRREVSGILNIGLRGTDMLRRSVVDLQRSL